jgi:hypothetical protein
MSTDWNSLTTIMRYLRHLMALAKHISKSTNTSMTNGVSCLMDHFWAQNLSLESKTRTEIYIYILRKTRHTFKNKELTHGLSFRERCKKHSKYINQWKLWSTRISGLFHYTNKILLFTLNKVTFLNLARTHLMSKHGIKMNKLLFSILM